MLVAQVGSLGSMLDEGPSTAMVLALAKVGIERFEDLGVHSSNRQMPEGRPDVLVDLGEIAAPGAGLGVEHLQPAVQQLVEGRRCAWVPLLVDLVEQSGEDLLGLRTGAWARRNGLPEVEATL